MPKKAIFDRKNVLVTGGAGFIGSHLCDELIKDSKVICIDDFSSGEERNIDHLLSNPNFEFIRHDISENINLEDISEIEKFQIKYQGIQEIYHAACPMSPRDFEKNKVHIILTNSIGTKNVLDYAVKHGAKFIHFSSSVVYGSEFREARKYKEEDVGIVDLYSARASYDESKRFAEVLVDNYRANFNIDTKILRIFRIYGPRMKLDDDQMIPDFVANALDGENLIIYGDENFSSSFCYISDIIDAIMKMAQSEEHGPINIGSDVDVNIHDLAKMIIQKTGSQSEIIYEPEKLFMKPLYLPDITKARNILAWMPVVTLENGIDKTIIDLKASKGLRNLRRKRHGDSAHSDPSRTVDLM